MGKKKTIYELNLHESTDVGRYEATRVPGGFIYFYLGTGGSCSVFVPEHTEGASEMRVCEIEIEKPDYKGIFRRKVEAFDKEK